MGMMTKDDMQDRIKELEAERSHWKDKAKSIDADCCRLGAQLVVVRKKLRDCEKRIAELEGAIGSYKSNATLAAERLAIVKPEQYRLAKRVAELEAMLDGFWAGLDRAYYIESREALEAIAASRWETKNPLQVALHHIWKRDPKVAKLEATMERCREAISHMEIIPDPNMGGTTDCCAMSFEDVDEICAALGVCICCLGTGEEKNGMVCVVCHGTGKSAPATPGKPLGTNATEQVTATDKESLPVDGTKYRDHCRHGNMVHLCEDCRWDAQQDAIADLEAKEQGDE